MNDPRTSTALRHLPLDDVPARQLSWAVVVPDRGGRVQLPGVAVALLGTGTTHAQLVDGILVLRAVEGPGRCIGIDRRGRLYVPVWLRRPALVVAIDVGLEVVVLADVAVLDTIGERLLQAARP